MGFMDKVKSTAGSMKDKAVSAAGSVKDKATTFAEEKKIGEVLANAKDGVVKAVNDSKENMKAYKEETNALKAPLEGAYIRYEVTYVGGLEDIPKRKAGAIGMNVMPDRFAFRVTITTKDWFYDFDIPYERVLDINIEKRTISTSEMLLGAGDSANQEQENVIAIEYKDELGVTQTLRVEMLTGTTIFNQAAKCKEFMSLLKKYDLYDKLKKGANGGVQQIQITQQVDVVEQLEKLAKLKDAGVLTEEEFAKKKAELLERM